MQTLHFDCDCDQCAVRLSALLLKTLEDTARITGCSITGLGRIVANDPRLYTDLLKGGRVCRPRTAERYMNALEDFLLECAQLEDEKEGVVLRIRFDDDGNRRASPAA